jgi:hypothetical protein
VMQSQSEELWVILLSNDQTKWIPEYANFIPEDGGHMVHENVGVHPQN